MRGRKPGSSAAPAFAQTFDGTEQHKEWLTSAQL